MHKRFVEKPNTFGQISRYTFFYRKVYLNTHVSDVLYCNSLNTTPHEDSETFNT